MTTYAWSTRIRHDSDATWQEWRDGLITALAAMVTGGVLAADETNITPGAGARPGTNTEGGYAVYHLDDSLHGTAPVYIRFGLGTGTGTGNPMIRVTVGTSTNGSGVIGGTAKTTIADINGNTNTAVDTARQSYLCCVAGYLGLAWKIGAGAQEGSFFFCRTCDANGAPTATGGMVHCGAGSVGGITLRQGLRFAATASAGIANTTVADGMLGFMPQSPTATSVGSDTQAALAWTRTPQIEPLFAVCGVYNSEEGAGTQFTFTAVGTTPRNFIAWSTGSGPFGHLGTTTQGGLCIAGLWE